MVFGLYTIKIAHSVAIKLHKGYSKYMSKQKTEYSDPPILTNKQVRQWLLEHPDFFIENTDILTELTPPEAQQGENIEDFQFHMLDRLQVRQRELKDDLEELIGVTRDNISTQAQVQEAVIALVKAESLEQLLHILTQDFAALFAVDSARIAIESPLAEEYETQFSEPSYSGIDILPIGGVDMAIGAGHSSFAILDTKQDFPESTKHIFKSCSGLIRSCILLRLTLPYSKCSALLGFGVRYPGRFHSGQSDELLKFLATVLALRLEPLLRREGLEEF